jgi:predicted  nucleic acid-binding Zn-ribbon protein
MKDREREELNSLNRELMVANAEYEELKSKLSKIGEKIFILKKRIEKLFNGD